jgi:hypothetical protein
MGKTAHRLWGALPALLAMALLTGCPRSKLPDPPSVVPQPKASVSLHHSLEI